MKDADINPKVCILMDDPFSGFLGGYRQAFFQAKAISENGIPIIILSLDTQKTNTFFKVTKIKENGLEIYKLSSILLNNKLLKYIFITFYLTKIIKKFTILQIITDHFCLVAAFFSIIFKKKIVFIETSTREYIINPKLFGKIKLQAISYASAIIIKNSNLYKIYKSKFPTNPKIYLIPNGVNVEKFISIEESKKDKLRNKFGFNKQDVIILYVGNILKEKGVDILIKQFIPNMKTVPNLKLLLIGNTEIDKKFSENLQKKIINNNIQDKVILYGKTNDIQHYYQISDIFVLPSRREGLPNVVLEAMSCGLPCVVSNLGYTEDLIKKDEGFIFDRKRPFQLRKIIEILSNSHLIRKSTGQKARELIIKNYSMRIIVEKYKEVYTNLM